MKTDISTTNTPSTSTSTSALIEADTGSSILDSRIRYERILVPHDGSEMSDRALKHAVYLSKVSGAEIVILCVIEHTGNSGKPNEDDIRRMLKERTNLCRKAGVKEVSYIIRSGKPADEIVKVVGESYYDLIVMASSRISSTIRIILGSNAKRVLDSVPKPILVIR